MNGMAITRLPSIASSLGGIVREKVEGLRIRVRRQKMRKGREEESQRGPTAVEVGIRQGQGISIAPNLPQFYYNRYFVSLSRCRGGPRGLSIVVLCPLHLLADLIVLFQEASGSYGPCRSRSAGAFLPFVELRMNS